MKLTTIYKLIPKPIRNLKSVDAWLNKKADAELQQMKQQLIKARWHKLELEEALHSFKSKDK